MRALVGELGEAIGPAPGVLAVVELLPGARVGEAEVRAAVDHHDVLAEGACDLRGLAVRQAEEDDVVAGEHVGGRRLQDPVGERHQVWLQRTEPLPRVGARGQGADLDLRVAQEQAEHLAPGVPTGSGDGD